MDIINEMGRLYPIAAELVDQHEAGLYHDIADYQPGRVKVHSLRQVEHLRNEVLAARSEQYYVSKITVLTDDKYRLGVTSRAYNRLANFIPISAGEAKRSLHGRFQKFERFSNAILQIKIENSDFVKYLQTFKVVKFQGKFYLDKTGDGEHVVDIEAPHKIRSEKEWGFMNNDGSYKEEIVIFGHLSDKSSEACATAGEIKKQILTMVAVKMTGLNAEAIQYALTYGASRALCDEVEGVSTKKDCAQSSTRLSQKDAPNTPLGYVNNFAVFFGKVKDVNGNEYRDGWGFVTNHLVSRLLGMLTGGKYEIADSAVTGLLLQCRPYLCKLMAETVTKQYLNRFIERMNKEVVVLFRNKLTVEDQIDFNLGMKTKGKEGRFAGKIVVLCDSEESWQKYGVQFFTDVNGLKAPFDLRFRTTLNVLDVSHGTADIENGASFSTQLCQSMMVADWPRTIKFVVSLFTKICLAVKNSILSMDAAVPRIGDLEKPRWNMLLAKVAPAFPLKFYFPIYKQIVKEACKGLVNMAERLKAPTEGFYAKIISDPGMDFGVNVLHILPDGHMEVVAPIASRNELDYGIAVKFPKQHYQEFGSLKFISPFEYASRVAKLIKSGEISLRDGQLLIEKVNNTSEGAIIMPAYERVKNMLAGMDYDGDACIVYVNRDIVNIMSKLKPLAVVIEPDDDKTRGLTVDSNVGFTAMTNAIENANLDVGAVTNLHLIYSILMVRAKFKTGPVEKIMGILFS